MVSKKGDQTMTIITILLAIAAALGDIPMG
jgi:hypothetical protein